MDHLSTVVACTYTTHVICRFKVTIVVVPLHRLRGSALRRAFEAHCRLETGGHTALESVLSVPPPQRDKMESFWLAETLK